MGDKDQSCCSEGAKDQSYCSEGAKEDYNNKDIIKCEKE